MSIDWSKVTTSDGVYINNFNLRSNKEGSFYQAFEENSDRGWWSRKGENAANIIDKSLEKKLSFTPIFMSSTELNTLQQATNKYGEICEVMLDEINEYIKEQDACIYEIAEIDEEIHELELERNEKMKKANLDRLNRLKNAEKNSNDGESLNDVFGAIDDEYINSIDSFNSDFDNKLSSNTTLKNQYNSSLSKYTVNVEKMSGFADYANKGCQGLEKFNNDYNRDNFWEKKAREANNKIIEKVSPVADDLSNNVELYVNNSKVKKTK